MYCIFWTILLINSSDMGQGLGPPPIPSSYSSLSKSEQKSVKICIARGKIKKLFPLLVIRCPCMSTCLLDRTPMKVSSIVLCISASVLANEHQTAHDEICAWCATTHELLDAPGPAGAYLAAAL